MGAADSAGEGQTARYAAAGSGALVNLGVLVYFKYANFLIDTVNQVAHLGLAALNIGTVLPLGISYYIFKIISYEVDVYTGKIAPEKNFITFAVYVLFFPQLIVGPIVKYREMADQLHDGANRCIAGKGRARRRAVCVRPCEEGHSGGLHRRTLDRHHRRGRRWADECLDPLAWLGIIAYSLQLYFDFAGYSEMSNGLAALLWLLTVRPTSTCRISRAASPSSGGAGILRCQAGSGITSTFPWAATARARRDSCSICSWSGCYRHLARGQLELYCLGPLLLCAAHD